MKKDEKLFTLCSRLDPVHYQGLDVSGRGPLSKERIRELTMKKLRQQPPAAERKPIMKKISIRVLIAAAILCLISVTALAVGGGEFFRSIFGQSAEAVEGSIVTPDLFEKNESYQIAAEGLLSDGYTTNLILSLEAFKGQKPQGDPTSYFLINFDGFEGAGVSVTELTEFSRDHKYYYRAVISSLESHRSLDVKVSLKAPDAPPVLTVPVSSAVASKTIQIGKSDFPEDNYRPETVQISPLGVLVIGSETTPKGGIPNTDLTILLKDGHTEPMEMLFDESADEDGSLIMGGGGVVIGGPEDVMPLIISSHGTRNPDNKVVTTGEFSRILNLDEVKAVIINGKEYPLY